MAEESKIVGVLDSIEDAINSASASLDEMNEKALKGGLGINSLIKSVESGTKVIDELIRSVGELGSAMTLGLDFGLINFGFGKLGDIFSMVMGSATELATIFDAVGNGIDSVTGYSRNLNSSLYESVSKFNGSFEAAKRFSDYIIDSAQDFATAEFGFITPAERIAAVKGLEQAGIPLEKMNEIITTSAGKMDLLNTSFLHSKSLGMEVGNYLEILSDAMLKQGQTTEQATEQMALFGDISNRTGLRVEKVARNLQGLATRFSKMGVTANFGQPILEGFVGSLNSMGLGFENAIELSETLSGSLAKLTSDYSTAYVTFQRGGLDFGGGSGALGASIGLRSELLKAEETGGQEEIGLQLANALKDTVASFTGGQIVTVKEAAENPALQQTFFTQTQLLKDLYGITETADQDRTLELLKQLEAATRTGDADLAESLGRDIQNTINSQNETLGYAEKTAAATEGTFAEIQLLNKNLIEAFRLSGDSLSDMVQQAQVSGLNSEMMQELISGLNEKRPEEMMVDFGDMFNKLKNQSIDGFARLSSDIKSLNIAQSLSDALSGMTLNVNNSSGDAILGELKGSIDSLVTKLQELLNRREVSGLLGS